MAAAVVFSSAAVASALTTAPQRVTWSAMTPEGPRSNGAEATTTLSPLAFASTSPWNSAIPGRPRLDPLSASRVRYLSRSTAVADLYDYGIPVLIARKNTPRQRVTCTEDWGSCPVARGRVPIPKGARPSRGSDSALVVIDPAARRVYEFWQAYARRGRWTVGWGDVVDLRGDGRYGTTGAGLSLLAGVVRVAELRAGQINHALAISTDNACRQGYRYPATKTDGHSTRRDCLPEGTRLQLDPRIDVARIPGITKGELAVARALQRYGGYVRDSGGARLAVIFEAPRGRFDPYAAAGLTHDYFAMSAIPWSRLRVLRSWNGR